MVIAGTVMCKELLNLRRVSAEILSDNKASQSIIAKAGYDFEGTRRGLVLRGGKVIDSLMYGRIL